ncbi:Protein of unknown function [Pyronema omphalodes CBS 100304]|uniref:Uncharacterized protein n=1 Tax=Pyronema omphalodes (strain CBS 100304) TaxID=1076935 RepID=U4LPL4_PYROM|nr:Protein of unknown function [Pyronema omphalodes CBS 100304]
MISVAWIRKIMMCGFRMLMMRNCEVKLRRQWAYRTMRRRLRKMPIRWSKSVIVTYTAGSFGRHFQQLLMMVLGPIGFFYRGLWISIDVPFSAEEIGPTHVKIAGYHHAVHRPPDHLHFSKINLLGVDFFNLYNVSQWNDFKKARAKLFFGRDWEMTIKKSKL